MNHVIYVALCNVLNVFFASCLMIQMYMCYFSAVLFLTLVLCPIGPTDFLGMCSIWDSLLPLDVVILEFMIQYDLLLDVESVVVKSSPNLLIEYDIFDDQSS